MEEEEAVAGVARMEAIEAGDRFGGVIEKGVVPRRDFGRGVAPVRQDCECQLVERIGKIVNFEVCGDSVDRPGVGKEGRHHDHCAQFRRNALLKVERRQGDRARQRLGDPGNDRAGEVDRWQTANDREEEKKRRSDRRRNQRQDDRQAEDGGEDAEAHITEGPHSDEGAPGEFAERDVEAELLLEQPTAAAEQMVADVACPAITTSRLGRSREFDDGAGDIELGRPRMTGE